MVELKNPITGSSFFMKKGKMLSEVCTWQIGGPANLFAEVHTEDELKLVLR